MSFRLSEKEKEELEQYSEKPNKLCQKIIKEWLKQNRG